MEYMIVEAENLTTLVQRVQGFLDCGWTPTGGPFAVTTAIYDIGYPTKIQYAQALTKPKPVELNVRGGKPAISISA